MSISHKNDNAQDSAGKRKKACDFLFWLHFDKNYCKLYVKNIINFVRICKNIFLKIKLIFSKAFFLQLLLWKAFYGKIQLDTLS